MSEGNGRHDRHEQRRGAETAQHQPERGTSAQAELAALGPVRYGRQYPQPKRRTVGRFRTAAVSRLARRPYYVNDTTRETVAGGFARVCDRLKLDVPACAIMNDHVHVVVLRSKYRIEYLVNQFKGAATSDLGLKKTPWTKGRWKVFLDDEEALLAGCYRTSLKLALDNGLSGPLIEPSSYFMKTPPTQFTDDVAKQKTEDFITKMSKKAD